MSKILNVEIKARCLDLFIARNTLKKYGADYIGLDHQVDTYFKCPNGRLKLRRGNIENSLIFYQRENQAGPKESNVTLAKLNDETNLRDTLQEALGVLVEVDKKREIYVIDNVKFHIDKVDNLGNFIEIEAIDETGKIGVEKLQAQCQKYMDVLNIKEKDLIEIGYSDILLNG